MKKFVSIILTAIVGLSVSACGGSAANNNPTTPSSSTDTPATTNGEAGAVTENGAINTTDKIELVVWESNNGPDEFVRQAGEKFSEKYPNITVKYVNVEVGDAPKQFALDGPAGVGPDVLAVPHDNIGTLVSGGHILAVEDPTVIQKDALASCLQAVTYDGKIYGYPVSAETYALFYNKKLIAENELPKIWDDVAAFCKGYNQGDQMGFMMDVGNAYYSILFTSSNDNRLFGKDGTDATKTYINTPEAVEGMKKFQELNTVIKVPAADMATAICDAAFSSGKSAMYVTGLWNVKPFTDAGIDFGVTTLPSLSKDGTPALSFSGTRTMQVSAYSKYPAESAAFAAFLMTPEMQKLRFDITGAIPATNIKVDSPYVPGFIEQLNYSYPMPSIPQMNGFWDAMNAASSNIWMVQMYKKN